jgi:hypothetical protein
LSLGGFDSSLIVEIVDFVEGKLRRARAVIRKISPDQSLALPVTKETIITLSSTEKDIPCVL